MIRDTNIVPLSRDHHHGLLFCWKIRRGIAKGIGRHRLQSYVIYFFKKHLDRHFQEEERLLFQDISSPLCLRALEEHRLIRELADAIEGDGPEESFGVLADLVDSHIRFEERQLFPFLEKSLSNEELSRVGAALNRLHSHPEPDSYEDEFWR